VYKLNKDGAVSDTKTVNYVLHYLQKGDSAPLNEYDNKLMEKTIGDNPTALAMFAEYKKLSNKEKYRDNGKYLTRIIEFYNK
jgi:hypothetical protein